MKILHIHPSLAGGGIESMICALANEMSKSEDVTVCSIFEPKSTDIFWFRLSKNVKKVNLGKKIGFSIKIFFSIYKFIRKGQFDVVNIHGMFYYYILSVFFLHKKTKFFYTIHSDAKMENTRMDKKILFLKKIFFRKSWVRPITISNTSQISFFNLYNCKSDLIFNGVSKPHISNDNPVCEYRIDTMTKVFIHAGRISIPKNQLILCRVFDRLINEGENVVLLIAGSKQSNEIFTSIEPFFCDRIIYLGERNDITQLMAYSDAMCLPSIWEGLPVTLLEALSVGCIPICSNVGGIPNVINSGENGLLSNSSTEEDYYMVMKRFLQMNCDEVNRMKQLCRESFLRYDISNTSELYLKTYQSY